jgi:hypothetical protein
MRTSTPFLLGASLLASSVLAELSYTAKMTHHGVEVPVNFIESPTPSDGRLSKPAQNVTSKRGGPISTTNNWAGAIQEAPVSGNFRSISAQWKVPGIYSPGPPLTEATYGLSQWVGIGSSCGVILQAGTAQSVS